MNQWLYETGSSTWVDATSSPIFPTDEVCLNYLDWMQEDKFVLMKKQETGEIIPLKQSKRGNSTYSKNQKKKVRKITEALDKIKFNDSIYTYYDEKGNPHQRCNTKALYFTLEFNSNNISLPDAWLSLKGRNSTLNQFKAYLKRHFEIYANGGRFKPGKKKRKVRRDFRMSTHSVREAHEKGYPHIHMIVIFSTSIPVEYHEKSGTWRLLNYSDTIPLRDAWERYAGSRFVDTQGVVDGRVTEEKTRSRYSIMSYLMKYLTKTVDPTDKKAVQTHALQKFFNVRDIFSKRFLEDIDATLERRDTKSNELKQIQRELQRLGVRISRLEALKHCFGFFLSRQKVELDNLYNQKAILEQQLKALRAQEPPPKWEYIGTKTFTDKRSYAMFYMELEKQNMQIKEQLVELMINGCPA